MLISQADWKNQVWSHLTKDITHAGYSICSVKASQGTSTSKVKNTTNLRQHLENVKFFLNPQYWYQPSELHIVRAQHLTYAGKNKKQNDISLNLGFKRV